LLASGRHFPKALYEIHIKLVTLCSKKIQIFFKFFFEIFDFFLKKYNLALACSGSHFPRALYEIYM